MQFLARTEVRDLILSICSLYVSKPESLEVVANEAKDGSTLFLVRGDPQDDSRLIGRDGSHIISLNFLVQQVGVEQKSVFNLKLLTSDVRVPAYRGKVNSMDYNPQTAREVVESWLFALGVEKLRVSVGPGEPGNSLSFSLNVEIEDRAKAKSLTVPPKGSNLFIVDALGTLIRAIGKHNGVRLELNLT